MGTSHAHTWITTTDYHTAGEPFRIVHQGGPELPGATVGERRIAAMGDAGGADTLRQLLCNEPRGHADMYGGFIVPADEAGRSSGERAHFGVLFWHKDGFSTACGHGTIALGVWATDTGLVESNPDGVTEVRIDVPSGRVSALVERSGGRLVGATFRNVASHVIAHEVPVETSRGRVRASMSFSGAIYAQVRASDVGLTVSAEHYPELIVIGREIKWALNDSAEAQYLDDPRLSGVYGTILWDDLGAGPAGPRQRNITVFADGEVDRSPCGSGTGARVAVLADQGVLPRGGGTGGTLEHRSIVDTVFHANWEAGPARRDGTPTVIPSVTGTAYLTGEQRFTLDPDDELGTGFTLR